MKVVNPDGSGADILVAFNAKKGINLGSGEAGNQVTVVSVKGGGGHGFSKSSLLGKLVSGANYTSPNFGGEPLTVQVDSISGSDSADIKIYFGSGCTVTPPPVPVPTNPPTSLPTTPPSSPPTSNPTPNPTPQPSSQPTPIPTSPPTPQPSNPPTALPSKSPTPSPTQQPTDAPTNNPTAQPTAPPTAPPTSTPEMTKTLVCGRGDIEGDPCVEGLKGTAPIDEMHEVRCCRDCTGINCSYPWKKQCSTFEPNLFARSKIGECKVGTFAEAIDFCRSAANTSRLCTPLEVENSCAKGTGCQFDHEQIWACAYDGHTCQADAECCGLCVNGTCQGEFNLFLNLVSCSAAE